MESLIISYCKIKENTVWVNGQLVFESKKGEDQATFMSSLYKSIELNYAKFFKMDKLCKLGILASELTVRNTKDFDSFPKNEMALLFANSASSLDTDRIHAGTIADKKNYFPSPSVFVYTLPNIVIGEIAIKHKITGENAFFVSEKFDAELMYNYTHLLLRNEAVSSAICGWVNVDGNSSEAFVYCAKNLNFKQEKSPDNNWEPKSHNSKNIEHLFSL